MFIRFKGSSYPIMFLRIFISVFALLFLGLGGCTKEDAITKKVSLRIWQTETDKEAIKVLNQVIADYQKQHPEVEIQLESVAWNSLSAKLAVAIQANNEPDVTHLEPFMANSLVSRNLILPIDDVIQDIERENGDQIFESVRDLQLFHGKRYGIAYAVGTTAFAYRKDIADRLGLSTPKTWDEFISFAQVLSSSTNGKLKVLLPGGDPFFIDQLFAELVANNGGVLFDPVTYRPTLDSKSVEETLSFLKKLTPYVDPGWQTQPYLDQFNRFGRGEAALVPVTYARASKAIERAVTSASSDTSLKANPQYFSLMPQPTGPSYKGMSIATIDCEPYVIFKSAQERNTGKMSNAEYAKTFLRMFYSRKYYLNFVKCVPMHLTPIFKGMAKSPEYLQSPLISTWQQWADQTDMFLSNPERVRPILMPDISEQGRQIPFLLEFQASRILSQAVTDVIQNKLEPARAAKKAQEQAERLLQSLGIPKRW